MHRLRKHIQVPGALILGDIINEAAIMEYDETEQTLSFQVGGTEVFTVAPDGVNATNIPEEPFDAVISDVNVSGLQSTALNVLSVDDSTHSILPYVKTLTLHDNASVTNAIGAYDGSNTDFVTEIDGGSNSNDIFITKFSVLLVTSAALDADGYGTRAALGNGITLLHSRVGDTDDELTDLVVTTHDGWGFYGDVTINGMIVTVQIDFLKLFGKPLYLRSSTLDRLIVRLDDNFNNGTIDTHTFSVTGYQY